MKAGKYRMSQKILSVVVPSYNTAGFIVKNIMTFLDEKILDDLEVLLINDGSTDNTCDIARKLENQYPNTVRVIDKENGGHGSVINVGIQESTGQYLKIVDGDDWVLTENLCRLINDLKKQNADVVLNPFYRVYANRNRSQMFSIKKKYCGENMPFQDHCNHITKLITLPAITYKTALLKGNRIRVREGIYYDDMEYSIYPIPFLESITIYDYPVYQYLVAQTNQSVSGTNLLKNQQMFYTIIKDLIAYYEKYQPMLKESARKLMKNFVMKIIQSQYNIYLRATSEKRAFEDMKQFNQDFLSKYRGYHSEVGRKYYYIKLLQTENASVFTTLSLIMRVYRILLRW